MSLIQYGLWCLLIWPQWKLYDLLINWQQKNKVRQITFRVLVLLIMFVGVAAAYEAWLLDHQPNESPMAQYFLFVRVIGLTCSALVLIAYAHFVAQHVRLRQTGVTEEHVVR